MNKSNGSSLNLQQRNKSDYLLSTEGNHSKFWEKGKEIF